MIIGRTKSDVDKLWNAFWTGGITNPVTVIEQINYLLFCRRLDDIETRNERLSARSGKSKPRQIFDNDHQECRWKNFRQVSAQEMFATVQNKVFPFLKTLGIDNEGVSTFSKTLSDAVFLIPKASLLQAAVDLISGLDLDNADTAGDLYEYLLSKLSTSGINGQFRTPRHIIKMMVELINPSIGERICDPACGTAGFLFASLQHVLEKNTSAKFIQIDEDGYRHGFVGDKLSEEQRKKFDTDSFYGFDFDPTMLRVSAMNMWLHGIEEPHIAYADSLSKNFVQENRYDVVLANPPFKGQLDYGDCSPSLLNEVKTKKTELLFLLLTLRILDLGGRAAIIVPDGVLFGNSNAHVSLRKMLIEDNQLEAVVSMPSGVFRPYAGVSTAVLLFTKGGKTDRVWFYCIENDGFTLDDKRQPIEDNDIADLIERWECRSEKGFGEAQLRQMEKLKKELSPLIEAQTTDLELIEQLRFDEVLGLESKTRSKELAKLESDFRLLTGKIELLQAEFNRLSKQFWVDRQSLKDNRYELSASRYRLVEKQAERYAKPEVIIRRLDQIKLKIESEMADLAILYR